MNIKECNKIAVIGGSGCGKTILTENLALNLKLPIYHLDGINYFENWVERDKKERDSIIENIISKDKWIIDGTYRSTLKQRLENADLIIYLDYSSYAQVTGIIKRFIKSGGKEKKEIKGCNERLNFKFLKWVLNWRKEKRDGIINILNEYSDEKKLIFKNRRSLNKWFKKEFNTKINLNY